MSDTEIKLCRCDKELTSGAHPCEHCDNVCSFTETGGKCVFCAILADKTLDSSYYHYEE